MSSQFLFNLYSQFSETGLCNYLVYAANLDSISSILLYSKFEITPHQDEDYFLNYPKFAFIFDYVASFHLLILQYLPQIQLSVIDLGSSLFYLHLIGLNILPTVSLIQIIAQMFLYLQFSLLFKIFSLLLYLCFLRLSTQTNTKNTQCLA